MLNYCSKQTFIHLKFKILMFILKALLIIEKVPHHSKIIISLCVCVFTVHWAVYYAWIMRWWCSNLRQRLLQAYDPLLIVTWIIKYPTLPHPPLTLTYLPPSGPPNPTPCPLSLLPVKPLHSIIWPLGNTPSPSQHTEKICYSTGSSAHLNVAHLWLLQLLPASPVANLVLLILALDTSALFLSPLLRLFHCCI